MKLSTALALGLGIFAPLSAALEDTRFYTKDWGNEQQNLVDYEREYRHMEQQWRLESLPQCARACLTNGWAKSGCTAPYTPSCMCRNKRFRDAAIPCVKSKCSMGDAIKTKDWAKEICKSITS